MPATTRMLNLLSLLQARRDWPGPVLADRLEISDRTLRRDVDRLRELGYRIRAIKGPDGGYRLDAGSELPPLLFDDEQAVVLALALQTVTVGGPEVEEAASRALATVRQVMPSRLRHRIDVLRAAVSSSAPEGSVDVDGGVLGTLATAIHESRTLRMDYRRVDAASDEPVRRTVQPHHLVARQGRWYLLAWDVDRGDWRTYRADRIDPRLPLGAVFRRREIPGGDSSAYLAARSRGSDTGRWPCEGEATLALPAHEVAPYLVDGWVEAQGDERCRVRLGAWSWPALAATLGRFDADVSAVDPPELADAFATLARRFSAASSAPSVV